MTYLYTANHVEGDIEYNNEEELLATTSQDEAFECLFAAMVEEGHQERPGWSTAYSTYFLNRYGIMADGSVQRHHNIFSWVYAYKNEDLETKIYSPKSGDWVEGVY